MNLPENLLYTNDHEWLRVEVDFAYLGITDFAQSQLGDIVFLEIETLGETLNQGDIFGTIEAVKTVSDLFLPIDAEVVEVNEAIVENPETINQDPYEKGWIAKIRIPNPEQLNGLLSANDYEKEI